MERFTIIGILGADAQLRESNGRQFITFDVAVTTRFKDKATGELRERTKWVSCLRNGKTNADAYLTRGTQVYLEGDVEATAWKDRDGNIQCGLKMHVWNFQLLGGRKQQQVGGTMNAGGIENTPRDQRPI